MWDPELIWKTCKNENSCPHQDSNSNPLVIQPIGSCCTDCAILVMIGQNSVKHNHNHNHFILFMVYLTLSAAQNILQPMWTSQQNLKSLINSHALLRYCVNVVTAIYTHTHTHTHQDAISFSLVSQCNTLSQLYRLCGVGWKDRCKWQTEKYAKGSASIDCFNVLSCYLPRGTE
jgi:hypothetical protein